MDDAFENVSCLDYSEVYFLAVKIPIYLLAYREITLDRIFDLVPIDTWAGD